MIIGPWLVDLHPCVKLVPNRTCYYQRYFRFRGKMFLDKWYCKYLSVVYHNLFAPVLGLCLCHAVVVLSAGMEG